MRTPPRQQHQPARPSRRCHPSHHHRRRSPPTPPRPTTTRRPARAAAAAAVVHPRRHRHRHRRRRPSPPPRAAAAGTRTNCAHWGESPTRSVTPMTECPHEPVSGATPAAKHVQRAVEAPQRDVQLDAQARVRWRPHAGTPAGSHLRHKWHPCSADGAQWHGRGRIEPVLRTPERLVSVCAAVAVRGVVGRGCVCVCVCVCVCKWL